MEIQKSMKAIFDRLDRKFEEKVQIPISYPGKSPETSKQCSSRLLWVTVSDLKYPVTKEALNQVFSLCGSVKDIIVRLPTTELRALICYEFPKGAELAMTLLNGRNIYDDGCRLKIRNERWKIGEIDQTKPAFNEVQIEEIAPQVFYERSEGKMEKVSPEKVAHKVFDEIPETKTKEHPSSEVYFDRSVSGLKPATESVDSEEQLELTMCLIKEEEKLQDVSKFAPIASKVFDEHSAKKLKEEHPFKHFLGDSSISEVKKDSGAQVKQLKAAEVAQIHEFQKDLVHFPVARNLFDERFEENSGKSLKEVLFSVALQLFDEMTERKWERDPTNDAFICVFQSDFGMESMTQLAVQIKEPQLEELTERRTSITLHSEFCNEVKIDGNLALYPFDRGKVNTSSKKPLLIKQLMFRDQFILELAIPRYSVRKFYTIASVEGTKAMEGMIMAAIQEHRRAALEETISIFQDTSVTSHTSFVTTEIEQGRSKAPAYALLSVLLRS